jgi:integrase
MTFHELFNEYLELHRTIQTPHEILNKQNRYDKHIFPVIGLKSLQDIRYKDCQQIVNNAIDVHELQPKTAKNIIAVVQTIFNYAIRNEYTEKNPSVHVIIPKFDNKYNINLTPIQIKSLVDNIFSFENELYRDIFIFALSGRRKSEILSITWKQIDLEMRVYHIPPSKNKSRKHDIHMMTDELHLMLSKRLANAKLSNKSNSEDFVFISPQTNTRLQDIKRPFARLKRLSKITSFRFHDFRHLIATYTLNNKKLPIEHISQALGHSSIEVTQKYITKDYSISKTVVDSFLSDFREVISS